MAGYQIDLRTFAGAGAVSIPTGVSVLALSEARMNNRRWKQDLLELLIAAQADWPDPDPDPARPSPVPSSVFDRLLETVTRPDAFFIAARGSEYVGVSCLHSFGTAVHPRFRGRGIATVLHAHALDSARQDGLARITRPSANRAMQAVFRKLGYQPALTELRMVLQLRRD
jgi:GNAT superfamily N-acetyltransferase